MNGVLEQLTSRSLDRTPLAIRPRQLSRFESTVPVRVEAGGDFSLEDHDAFAPSDSAWRDDPVQPVQPQPAESVEQPRLDHHTTPDLTASWMAERLQHAVNQSPGVAPLVPKTANPPSSKDGAETLTRRLDQLDRQLQRFADRDRSSDSLSTSVPSVRAEEVGAVESISRVETHHHHQHHTANNYHSQIITPANEQVVVAPQSERQVSVERTTPNIVAEGKPSGKRQVEVSRAAPHIDHPRINSAHRSPAPQVIVKPIVSASSTEPSRRAQQPATVPQIVVEHNTANEPTRHTVTVTIGRIEVRAPQKPAARVHDKPKGSAARIMSLDDYMRRRAGGAG